MDMSNHNQVKGGSQYLSSQSERVIQGPTQHSYSAHSTTRTYGPTGTTTQEYSTGQMIGGSRQRSIGGSSLHVDGREMMSGAGYSMQGGQRYETSGYSRSAQSSQVQVASSTGGQASGYASGAYSSGAQGSGYAMSSGYISGQTRHITDGTSYTTGQVVSTYTGKERVVDTRVIGVERGMERLVSTTEHEGESVVHERYEHQRVKVPKKVIREEVIEKVYIVPETIQIEEYVEDEVEVEEKIVEVAKKIIVEKIVEVPEIEIVERIIEVPETVVREKIREVPKIETVEKIVEVPVEQIVERCVSVPQIEYKDVPVEKIVEVPEIRTEEIIREVAVPQHSEKTIERVVYVEEGFEVERKLPVPVEAEVILEYCLPELVPRYSKKKFPVYLPRFIEVPIARQFADAQMLSQGEAFAVRVNSLTTIQPAMALCEIENLAKEIKDVDFVKRYETSMMSGQHFEKMVQSFHTDMRIGGSGLSHIQTGASMGMGAMGTMNSTTYGARSYGSSAIVGAGGAGTRMATSGMSGGLSSSYKTTSQHTTHKDYIVNQAGHLLNTAVHG